MNSKESAQALVMLAFILIEVDRMNGKSWLAWVWTAYALVWMIIGIKRIFKP